MAVAATLNRAIFAADESFIRLNNAAGAAHGRKIAGAHCLANALTQQPCTLESNPECAMKLISADALFRGTNQVDRSQPIAHCNVAVFENCSDLHGKWLPARIAFVKSDAISLALKRRRAVEHPAMRTHAA